MKIVVVGLGLIGGSFCKAIKAYTPYTCFGIDVDKATMEQAVEMGAIDEAITVERLGECDLVLVCLHPEATISFVKNHMEYFRAEQIVMDVCGVKQKVIEQIEGVLLEKGTYLVSTHPMAGREFSGFEYAQQDLYKGASFIITTTQHSHEPAVEAIRQLAKRLQFGKVVTSTALVHDQTIAFTSQLAHVVSNGYIKSPTLAMEAGFSANSFLDLTRVAKLNEYMWSELFLYNKEPLIYEIETIITHLQQYKEALQQEDKLLLQQLLREGSILKEESLQRK